MDDDTDTPVLKHTPGGWLASSRDDFPRIGAMAASREEAEAQYRAARERWRNLLRQAQADPVTHA